MISWPKIILKTTSHRWLGTGIRDSARKWESIIRTKDMIHVDLPARLELIYRIRLKSSTAEQDSCVFMSNHKSHLALGIRDQGCTRPLGRFSSWGFGSGVCRRLLLSLLCLTVTNALSMITGDQLDRLSSKVPTNRCRRGNVIDGERNPGRRPETGVD